MAEPLKNSFGPDIPVRIADMILAAYPTFDKATFIEQSLDGFEEMELTQRAGLISSAMSKTLPSDGGRALEVLILSLGPEAEEAGLKGMEPFIYLPHVYFVAEHGLESFEMSMKAQHELTRRFTAEFSIRAFLERYPKRTLDRLRIWATDPNFHVRRLVSEGTRPRLPWASRLRAFQFDPTPVLDLLELLKDDPEEYVRRSVANNLNDISKDHPEVAVDVARQWWKDSDANRKRLVRHGLRTLIKQGDPHALEVLGYSQDCPARIVSFECDPVEVEIGGRIRLLAEVWNPSRTKAGVLVDFRIHFIKASGKTSPRVFKGGEVLLEPGSRRIFRKTISIAQLTTRTHHKGTHRVEVLLNGIVHPGAEFDVV